MLTPSDLLSRVESRESVPEMSQVLPAWGKRTGQVLLTAFLTWLIFRGVGVTLEEVRNAPGSLPPAEWGVLLVSAVLLLLAFLLVGRSWGWMVRDLGGEDPGPTISSRVVLLANLGRYLPGKVWQIAGLAWLGKQAGVPATVSTSAGVLLQCFGLAAAGLAALPALVVASGDLESLLMPGVILLLFLAAVSTPRILRMGLAPIFRLAKLPNSEIPEGSPFFGPRWMGFHLFIWGIYGIAFLLLLRSVGVEGQPVFFASTFAAAYLAGYLALFAPAGFGVREGVLVALLRPEIGGAAVGVALLARIWITVVEILPAGILALYRMPGREGGRK